MFEHSIRVPRNYKVAANILKKVSTEGGSVKSLLYDDKLRFFRTNVLYALITEAIKHAAYIDKIFESCKLFENEARLDPWLAKILTAELLFGKKSLPGNSKPEQTIRSYRDQFEKYQLENLDDLKTEAIPRPRYVRINTNLLTTSDAIRAFQDEGYKFIRCTSGSYNDYLQQIQSLTEYDFTQDYHVKTIFVFSPSTKLHDHDLYLENQIILQDKATAMAVHLLAPPPGSITMDMCAAPGMKTTQLAAYMRNEGKIYAVERNEERYKTLCDFVERSGSKCVETINKDVLEIRKGDCNDVEYILLDPSCSGSGMDLTVHNYIEETRLAKLTSLQEKFLKHALNAFPKAKRIVYSTCSLFPEENERVITNVIKASRTRWIVRDVKELLKGQWNNIGSGMYGSMGPKCMYAKPELDFTTGFFLAVLDREPKDVTKTSVNTTRDSKPKDNTIDEDTVLTENKDDRRENHELFKKKKKDKSKLRSEGNSKKDNDEDILSITATEDTKDKKEKHKKKKKKRDNIEHSKEDFITSNNESICTDNPENTAMVIDIKKKKKKSRESNVLEEESPEVVDIVDSSLETEKSSKKKKRKIDEYTNIEMNEITEETTLQKNTAHTKKKKKKLKNQAESLDNIEKNICVDTHSTKKKKKRDKDL